MRDSVTLDKRWISDLRADGCPHILFGPVSWLMEMSHTKVPMLHVDSSPSKLHRLGQNISGIHRKGTGKDAHATTMKDSSLLYVLLTLIADVGGYVFSIDKLTKNN